MPRVAGQAVISDQEIRNWFAKLKVREKFGCVCQGNVF